MHMKGHVDLAIPSWQLFQALHMKTKKDRMMVFEGGSINAIAQKIIIRSALICHENRDSSKILIDIMY